MKIFLANNNLFKKVFFYSLNLLTLIDLILSSSHPSTIDLSKSLSNKVWNFCAEQYQH